MSVKINLTALSKDKIEVNKNDNLPPPKSIELPPIKKWGSQPAQAGIVQWWQSTGGQGTTQAWGHPQIAQEIQNLVWQPLDPNLQVWLLHILKFIQWVQWNTSSPLQQATPVIPLTTTQTQQTVQQTAQAPVIQTSPIETPVADTPVTPNPLGWMISLSSLWIDVPSWSPTPDGTTTSQLTPPPIQTVAPIVTPEIPIIEESVSIQPPISASMSLWSLTWSAEIKTDTSTEALQPIIPLSPTWISVTGEQITTETKSEESKSEDIQIHQVENKISTQPQAVSIEKPEENKNIWVWISGAQSQEIKKETSTKTPWIKPSLPTNQGVTPSIQGTEVISDTPEKWDIAIEVEAEGTKLSIQEEEVEIEVVEEQDADWKEEKKEAIKNWKETDNWDKKVEDWDKTEEWDWILSKIKSKIKWEEDEDIEDDRELEISEILWDDEEEQEVKKSTWKAVSVSDGDTIWQLVVDQKEEIFWNYSWSFITEEEEEEEEVIEEVWENWEVIINKKQTFLERLKSKITSKKQKDPEIIEEGTKKDEQESIPSADEILAKSADEQSEVIEEKEPKEEEKVKDMLVSEDRVILEKKEKNIPEIEKEKMVYEWDQTEEEKKIEELENISEEETTPTFLERVKSKTISKYISFKNKRDEAKATIEEENSSEEEVIEDETEVKEPEKVWLLSRLKFFNKKTIEEDNVQTKESSDETKVEAKTIETKDALVAPEKGTITQLATDIKTPDLKSKSKSAQAIVELLKKEESQAKMEETVSSIEWEAVKEASKQWTVEKFKISSIKKYFEIKKKVSSKFEQEINEEEEEELSKTLETQASTVDVTNNTTNENKEKEENKWFFAKIKWKMTRKKKVIVVQSTEDIQTHDDKKIQDITTNKDKEEKPKKVMKVVKKKILITKVKSIPTMLKKIRFLKMKKSDDSTQQPTGSIQTVQASVVSNVEWEQISIPKDTTTVSETEKYSLSSLLDKNETSEDKVKIEVIKDEVKNEVKTEDVKGEAKTEEIKDEVKTEVIKDEVKDEVKTEDVKDEIKDKVYNETKTEKIASEKKEDSTKKVNKQKFVDMFKWKAIKFRKTILGIITSKSNKSDETKLKKMTPLEMFKSGIHKMHINKVKGKFITMCKKSPEKLSIMIAISAMIIYNVISPNSIVEWPHVKVNINEVPIEAPSEETSPKNNKPLEINHVGDNLKYQDVTPKEELEIKKKHRRKKLEVSPPIYNKVKRYRKTYLQRKGLAN